MDKNLFFYELEGRGYIFQNKKWDEAKHVFEDDMLNMAWEMWSSAKHSVKAQAVPEWISVEDEFPKKNLKVLLNLVTRKNGKPIKCIGFYSIEPDEEPCFVLDDNFTELKGVTHWVRLPDSPKAQESAPLKLGDLVEPIDHRYTLASGCERYPYAYVVNTKPFQLMSEEGDMYWRCTVEAGGYKLIKSNDQLPEAVSLRMIREGLLAPVETQEQSHE